VHIIDCHYTFIDKLLLESFQTTVGISRVGMSPHTPPPADTHDLTTVHDKTTGIIEKKHLYCLSMVILMNNDELNRIKIF